MGVGVGRAGGGREAIGGRTLFFESFREFSFSPPFFPPSSPSPSPSSSHSSSEKSEKSEKSESSTAGGEYKSSGGKQEEEVVEEGEQKEEKAPKGFLFVTSSIGTTELPGKHPTFPPSPPSPFSPPSISPCHHPVSSSISKTSIICPFLMVISWGFSGGRGLGRRRKRERERK